MIENNETNILKNDSDNESQKFVGDRLTCFSCSFEFGIIENYIGIVNCPYCGDYVEGM